MLRRWMQLIEDASDDGQDDDFDGDETYGDEDDDTRFDNLPASAAINQLRPQLVQAAQKVYDGWRQDEDDDLAGGGICHLIADQMAHILSAAGIPVWTVSSTHEVHVYCVAQCVDGVFEVDIPWSVYERGGGYTWTKLPNIVFDQDNVSIERIDADPARIGQYVDEF